MEINVFSILRTINMFYSFTLRVALKHIIFMCCGSYEVIERISTYVLPRFIMYNTSRILKYNGFINPSKFCQEKISVIYFHKTRRFLWEFHQNINIILFYCIIGLSVWSRSVVAM